MRVLITGGGTGGHIYPALAIARGIKERDLETKILFVGNSAGLEAEIIPREGFDFRSITVQGLPRKLTRVVGVVKALAKTLKGGGEAYKILKDYKPSVVIGTGGYVCFSVVMLAALLKIPTLIQEQNAFPGRANRILSRVTSKVAVAFPESQKYFPRQKDIVVTGLPVRPEIISACRETGISAFNLDPEKFTIVVVGGSQGARSLNKAMLQVVGMVAGNQKLQLIHVTGQKGYEETLKELEDRGIDYKNAGNITIKPYLHNMNDALAAADLVICRAGATTIAEVTVRGLPSILIPYPYAANNHQEYNAQALVRRGAAKMILDRDLTGDKLLDELGSLVNDKMNLSAMGLKSAELGKPEALKHLVEIVYKLAR